MASKEGSDSGQLLVVRRQLLPSIPRNHGAIYMAVSIPSALTCRICRWLLRPSSRGLRESRGHGRGFSTNRTFLIGACSLSTMTILYTARKEFLSSAEDRHGLLLYAQAIAYQPSARWHVPSTAKQTRLSCAACHQVVGPSVKAPGQLRGGDGSNGSSIGLAKF